MNQPTLVPLEAQPYALDAELTLRADGALLANGKRIELLRQIGVTENLTRAAKLAGYSYKGAWDTIEQMTQLTGGSLLERHAGGKGGGRTRLTERGKQLLKNFTLIQGEHARFIERLNRLANGLDAEYAVQTGIAMKTSARNQFGAIIVSITPGPVNDEVGLMLGGSMSLLSSITHESCRDLKLSIGAKVFALIKASSIELRAPDEPLPATRNVFDGTIKALIRGEHRSELCIAIDQGAQLICTAANAEIDRHAFVIDARIRCEMDPSSVIIAVAA